jgi:hypothetical protein
MVKISEKMLPVYSLDPEHASYVATHAIWEGKSQQGFKETARTSLCGEFSDFRTSE